MKVSIAGGCGHAMCVLKAYQHGTRFESGGICPSYPGDPDSERLLKAFQEAGLSFRRYNDYHSMLDYELPDVVIVDGMFGQHAEMAVDALQRGVHVLADKPAAVSEEQFLQISQAVSQSSALYWSMLTCRYDPWYVTAWELVQAGEIGDVRLIDAQKSYKLGKRPDFYADTNLYGGTVNWVGIHLIDLVLWITGKRCKSVAAFGSSIGNGGYGSLESTLAFSMKLEEEILASLRFDYCRPAFASTHGDDRIRIVGMRGSVEVRDNQVWLLNEEHPVPTVIPSAPGKDLFADFLLAAEGKDHNARICPEQSLYCTQVALDITQALRENRIVNK